MQFFSRGDGDIVKMTQSYFNAGYKLVRENPHNLATSK